MTTVWAVNQWNEDREHTGITAVFSDRAKASTIAQSFSDADNYGYSYTIEACDLDPTEERLADLAPLPPDDED